MQDLVLKVNGNAYVGWKEIMITQSLNNLSGGFSFLASERYPQIPTDWNLRLGDPCSVEINGQQVIVGYIEDVNISYDASGHTIEIAGRDVTCDLVDSSFAESQSEFKNQTLKSILTKICDNFGIPLFVDNLATVACNKSIPDGTIKIHETEQVMDLISRLCKSRAVIPVSYGDGKLTITRAGGNGNATDPIQLGYNILAGAAELSNKERFYSYTVKGQGTGFDYKSIEEMSTYKNSKIQAIDTVIKRQKRVLALTMDSNTNISSCNDYANWEKNLRAGNSRKYHYTLVEWTQSDGTIWKLNSLVNVIDKQLSLRKDFLISGIEYRYDGEGGSTTKLSLVDKSTYTLFESKITDMRVDMDMDYTEVEEA